MKGLAVVIHTICQWNARAKNKLGLRNARQCKGMTETNHLSLDLWLSPGLTYGSKHYRGAQTTPPDNPRSQTQQNRERKRSIDSAIANQNATKNKNTRKSCKLSHRNHRIFKWGDFAKLKDKDELPFPARALDRLFLRCFFAALHRGSLKTLPQNPAALCLFLLLTHGEVHG